MEGSRRVQEGSCGTIKAGLVAASKDLVNAQRSTLWRHQGYPRRTKGGTIGNRILMALARTGTGTGIGIGNGIGIGGGEQQSAKNSAKKGKMGAEAEADEARFRLQRG